MVPYDTANQNSMKFKTYDFFKTRFKTFLMHFSPKIKNIPYQHTKNYKWDIFCRRQRGIHHQWCLMRGKLPNFNLNLIRWCFFKLIILIWNENKICVTNNKQWKYSLLYSQIQAGRMLKRPLLIILVLFLVLSYCCHFVMAVWVCNLKSQYLTF